MTLSLSSKPLSEVSSFTATNGALRQAEILVCSNQKGGVGKTTTAVNLAASLAVTGVRVLLIDADPQGNASTGVGVVASSREYSLYDVMVDNLPVQQAIMPTLVDSLHVISASVDLAGAEVELAKLPKREFLLKEVLQDLRSEYDFIIIDCPPALGFLTINALTAGDRVLVPLQAEFYALEGLSYLLKTIQLVQRQLNPKLRFDGIILTMFDRRNRLSSLVYEDVKETLSDKVYDTIIPRNVKISEAPSHGKPVLLYDRRSQGALAYVELAKEVLNRGA